MSKSAFTDAYASVVDTLVALRKRQGVSQVELAARLGKSQQFVSYIERTERRIDLIEFYVIVKALESEPEIVFRDVVHRFPEHVTI